MAHIPTGTVSQSSWGPSSLPFAMPDAGFDYFATDAHYRSLASRIITALGGFNVVVVTGDRRLSTPTLSTALGDAIAGRYTVMGFPCEPEPSRHDVLRFRRAVSTSSANNGAAGGVSGLPALIVFDDADRFSDKEIEEIFAHVHQRSGIGDHRIAAVVFLASTEFLTRLERPVLRFWLAKRVFVARLRFHELGADEISAFIHQQLPVGEAESTFNDAAIAAIANVSGGDPAVVNRFARRMLDSVAANTGDTSVKANVGSATMVPPDMLPEERGVTTFREQPRQNRVAPELGMWRDRRVTLKLCAGIVFCFACVGVVAAVIHINLTEEDIAASGSTPAKDTSAKVPERGSLTSWPPPEASMPLAAVSPPEEPTAVPGKAALTATTTPAAPTAEETPEDALPVKMPAQSPSLAALHPTAEVAAPTEAPEKIVSATISPAATPTGASPIATAVSPTGTQAPKSTPSAPGPPPAQLRLPAAEITALLARGDTLFAQRDISSARLFYERAADAGEGRAALRLGETFDPVFLDFTHLGVRGDSAMAVSWYGRARELGEAEAEILLKRLEPLSSK
jgi:hypothetical protein